MSAKSTASPFLRTGFTGEDTTRWLRLGLGDLRMEMVVINIFITLRLTGALSLV